MTRCLIVLAALACVATGCNSGGGSGSVKVGAARVYHLTGFSPAGGVHVGVPVTLSFTVTKPSGAPLVHYRTGPGPHVGVHLILVRDDLATIIHRHPPVGKDGVVRQTVTFSEPGPYHVLVDLYPATNGPGYVNFQLFQASHVLGAYHPQPLPPYHPEVTVGGWHFTIKTLPPLHLAQAALIDVNHQERRRATGGIHTLVRRHGGTRSSSTCMTSPISTPTSVPRVRPAAPARSGRPRSRGARPNPG